MADIVATWTAELNCTCPQCENYVDLTCDDNFWNVFESAIFTCSTIDISDMAVKCPACGHEFLVDCEY